MEKVRLWHAGRCIAVFTLALATTSCHRRPDVAAGYHEYAYVTNGKSNSVSVIDVTPDSAAQLRNIKTIAVWSEPTGITANPKRNEVYVANAESNNISIINTEVNQQVAVIGVQRAPYYVAVSTDGKRAYVANSGSANVSVIDVDRRAVISTIGVGGAPGIARVSPDGKLVVASNRGQ